MKKFTIGFTITFLTLMSCKKEKIEPLTVPTVQEEMAINEYLKVCYQGIMKSDTINLSMQIDSNQLVKGELAYLFFEKDRSKGTFEGQMFGDTLKGVYTFASEGKESKREIVFLKKEKF